MKKITYLLLVFAIIALIYSSCKKGAVGPQGATGTPGAVGPAGPAGANGQNGSVIYSGTTLPETTTGVVGDYYLNTTTGLLYGPKTTSGWGTGFSMIGPAGADGKTGATGATGAAGATGKTGAAGNSVLSGTVILAAALGNAGDYYLDIATYMLYGPKAASGWGTAVPLQGPAGGASNVEYSGWNVATNPRDTTFASTHTIAEDLAAPALTQNMINGGIIMVYMRYQGEVFPLPYTSYYANNKYATIGYLLQPGHFILTRFLTDDDHLNSNALPSSLIRLLNTGMC